MNDVGRFMFGVGALLCDESTGRILLLKRAQDNPFNSEKWEIVYGRVQQGEDIDAALRREVNEEIGVSDFRVMKPLRFWHFYRGKQLPENEIMGMTFLCSIQERALNISTEHSDYLWIAPDKALDMVSVDGIRQDIRIFAEGAVNALTLTKLDGTHSSL